MNSFPQIPSALYSVFIVWGLFWKGLALWKASRNDQRNWFIAMLILNTVGILEIVYLFRFAKTRLKLSELMFWKKAKEIV